MTHRCTVKFLLFGVFIILDTLEQLCQAFMFTSRCKISKLDRAEHGINTGGHICKQWQWGLSF